MKRILLILILIIPALGFSQIAIDVSSHSDDTLYLYTAPTSNRAIPASKEYNYYPTATDVTISGSFNPDSTLTVNYTYYDHDGDLENTDTQEEEEEPTSYEDFTEYTEVDPESDFTVEANKLTVTDIHPEHTTTYLYYDFGAGYFKRNFEIRFALKVTGIWEDHAIQGIIGVGRTVSFAVEGPSVELNYDYTDAGEGANYIIGVGGGDHVAHSNQNQFLVGTTYYIKVERTYVGGAEDNTFFAMVYTDENYTVRAKNLYGGQVGDDIAQWGEEDFSLAHATEEFRYLIIASSSRDDYSDTEYGSFEISNVEIISNED